MAGNASYFIEATNFAVLVANRTPSGQTHILSPAAFLHSECVSAGWTDPRVRWDPYSGRWFILYARLPDLLPTESYGWCLSYSDTADPYGTWQKLYIPLTQPRARTFPFRNPANGTVIQEFAFADYPGLVVTDEAVVITGNPASAGVVGVSYALVEQSSIVYIPIVAIQLNLSIALRYPPPLLDPADPFPFYYLLQPAQTLPPYGSFRSVWLAGHDVGQYQPSGHFNFNRGRCTKVRRVQMPDSGGPYGPPGLLPTDEFSAPAGCSSAPPPAPQAGTNRLIDTGDVRDVDAMTLGAGGGAVILVGSTACTLPGDTPGVSRACIRYTGIYDPLIQASEAIFGAPGQYWFYPALVHDGANNDVVVFNVSSSNSFVSLYGTGHINGDPRMTLRTPTVLKAGNGPYTGVSPNEDMLDVLRWGDYSSAQIDGANFGNVILSGEYASGAGGYGTGEWTTAYVVTDHTQY